MKELENDLFKMSESLRIGSLRASQNFLTKKDLEYKARQDFGIDDEKMRKIIERTETNSKNAENFRKEREKERFHDNFEMEFMKNTGNTGYPTFRDKNEKVEKKNEFSIKKNESEKFKQQVKNSVIDKGFYDDSLFQLVDDLEKDEKMEKMSGTKPIAL